MTADSTTRKALAIALQGAAEYGVDTTLLELRDFNLVFCGSVPAAVNIGSTGVGQWSAAAGFLFPEELQ
jgi:hypothetical protein